MTSFGCIAFYIAPLELAVVSAEPEPDVIDDQQTWTSGQKAMSHLAKTLQQFAVNSLFCKAKTTQWQFSQIVHNHGTQSKISSIMKIEFFFALSYLSELSQKIN